MLHYETTLILRLKIKIIIDKLNLKTNIYTKYINYNKTEVNMFIKHRPPISLPL